MCLSVRQFQFRNLLNSGPRHSADSRYTICCHPHNTEYSSISIEKPYAFKGVKNLQAFLLVGLQKDEHFVECSYGWSVELKHFCSMFYFLFGSSWNRSVGQMSRMQDCTFLPLLLYFPRRENVSFHTLFQIHSIRVVDLNISFTKACYGDMVPLWVWFFS